MVPGMNILRYFPLFAFSVLLTACFTSDDDAESSLTLRLTDAPIDEAEHVFVSVRGVSLNAGDEGWVDYDLDEVQRIDLLTLQSGNAFTLLDDIAMEAGAYGVRLNLHSDDDNQPDHAIVLTQGGAEIALEIPSGEQTGLKLNQDIVVPVNGDADYVIDFDVRRSIVKRGLGDDYSLKPVLRLINNSQTGSITGAFTDSQLFTEQCSDQDPLTFNAVYLYEGHDVTADDIGSAGAQPITTAPVIFDEDNGEYRYTIGFVLTGDYTLSLTCNADLENSETDDELLFKQSSNVMVQVESEEDES